jgi:MtN3 and saliva related transmembrane protein
VSNKQTLRSDKFLKQLVLFVAIAEPLLTIPQIYQIWSTRSAAGVSLVTWAGYVITGVVWLVYGIRIKDRPLIISSAMWVLTEGLVLVGALIY